MKYGVRKSVKRLLHIKRIPLCIIAGILAFGSCSDKDQVPEGVLEKEKMVNVLSDLYLAEQKINSIGVKRDSLKQIFETVRTKIFIKAGTTDSVFKRSMDYYMEHPEIMESLYTSLIDSLNLQEQKMILSESKK